MVDSAWQNAAHGQAWVAWLDSGEWERSLDTFSPMVPALAVEIAMLASDPDISAIKLTQAVSKDPILAVNVIRLANSAWSASATTITSLNEAVVRVGTRAVRQLVTAACLTAKLRNPKTYGANARLLVDHAIGTAYLAWMVADRADADPDAAFLAGLLHDIGKFVILKLANDDHPAPPTMGQQRLWACITARHAHVGGRALARWRLAEPLQMAVTWHHEPAQAHGYLEETAIIYAANRLAHRYGFGCEASADDLLDDPTLVKLGLDADFLATLDTRVPGLFEVARAIAA